MNQRVRCGEFLSALLIYFLLAVTAWAATSIRACTALVDEHTQKAYYERFVIVGEKEHDPDAPEEWWGTFPDRPPVRDAEGRARAVNVPKEQVLKVGEHRIIHGHVCTCPDFW